MVTSLFVHRWGRGPEVVFLHGLGASSHYWQALAQDSSDMPPPPPTVGLRRSPASRRRSTTRFSSPSRVWRALFAGRQRPALAAARAFSCCSESSAISGCPGHGFAVVVDLDTGFARDPHE